MKSIKLQSKKDKMANFEAAKKLALQLDRGRMKRVAPATGILSGGTYHACTSINGDHYVLGDTLDDIPKPTCYIHGRPALKIINDNTKLIL
jgi:hypothetical protein